MTQENKLLYLSRSDVESIGLSMSEIIEGVDAMFKEKGAGRVEMPPKPGIHPMKDAFIHAMPAFIPASGAAGMKWIAGFPENIQTDVPYISGLLILNDAKNGLPLAVMDATWITAQRTGAATAVAARYLAREDSSTIAILACGVQGRSNLEAVSCLFPLTKVKVFDINSEAALLFKREMGAKFAIDVEICSSPKDAMAAADIVVTSGPIYKKPQPVIETGWLAPGAFACPLDYDSYWKTEAMQEIDKLATDDLNQLNFYRDMGYFQTTPNPYADLGDVATGKIAGRESDDERTMSINLGLAAEDMATASLLYKKARQKGLGIDLAL